MRATVWPKRARESFGVGSAIEIVVHPNDLSTVAPGTSAAGIAADAMGKVYAADVDAHRVRKYIRLR